MPQHIAIGGLVALGFDPSCEYLLTISHSGRGLFSTNTWQRVTRDYELAYPDDGRGMGIGPIEGQPIDVVVLNPDCVTDIASADGRIVLRCESSGISVICVDDDDNGLH